MRLTASFIVLVSAVGLLACADPPTAPAGGRVAEPPEAAPQPQAPSAPQPEAPPQVPTSVVLAFVSTRDGAEHIYVANTDGSEVTRVAEGSSPAWSWDGRRIAFVRKASTVGPAGIYVMNFDGSQLTHVGAGQSPAWSPDGRILFMRSRPWLTGYDLFVMNSDGSAVTPLFSSPETTLVALAGRAAWSPDGHSFVYRMGGRIVIHDAAGSIIHEIDELPDNLTSVPAWSPDGSRIAFTTFPGPWQVCDWFTGCAAGPGLGKSSLIYSYHLASAEWEMVDAIYPAPAARAANPDWSPDASQLVFDLGDLSTVCWGSCPTPGSDSRRIFALTVGTGEVRRLIPDAANPAVTDYDDYSPVWARTMHRTSP